MCGVSFYVSLLFWVRFVSQRAFGLCLSVALDWVWGGIFVRVLGWGRGKQCAVDGGITVLSFAPRP